MIQVNVSPTRNSCARAEAESRTDDPEHLLLALIAKGVIKRGRGDLDQEKIRASSSPRRLLAVARGRMIIIIETLGAGCQPNHRLVPRTIAVGSDTS